MCGWSSSASGRGGLAVVLMAGFATGGVRADTIDVPGDYPTIQAAIDASVDGDEIVIDDGTWTGPGNRNLDPGGRSIVIRSSGGASACTVDCDNLGRAFFIHSGETVRLVGLSIVNGMVEEVGGGAVLVESSNLTAEDCVFSDNRVLEAFLVLADDGGAVFLIDAVAVFVRCSFIANRIQDPENGFGGAISCDGGLLTMTDCTLVGNVAEGYCTTAAGGGLGVRGAEAILLRCDFRGNIASGGSCGGTGAAFGGGIAITGATGRLTAIACTFQNNRARASGSKGGAWAVGGGVQTDSGATATFVNCRFTGNEAASEKASAGGAFAGAGAMINCTVLGNASFSDIGEAGAGGIVASSLTVTNCIVWDNQPDAIQGPAIVTHSNVEGGWDGIGNIDADPMFVSGGLRAGSPCIDAGDNFAVISVGATTDLDGLPRFVDDPDTEDTGFGGPPVVDMGAYEFQVVCVADLDVDGDVGFGDLLAVLSNWGPCAGCPEDLDGDDEVGFSDLLIVLSNWGSCTPTGACCLPDGACQQMGPSACASLGGAFSGDETVCADVTCIEPGACCFLDGSCEQSDVGSVACAAAGGVYFGEGLLCADVTCAGACCLLDGSCEESDVGGVACMAAGGVYVGGNTLCADVVCAQPGACCLPDGDCQQSDVGGGTCVNQGGIYVGDDSLCDDVTCQSGACCLPDFDCQFFIERECDAAGGTFLGEGSICNVNCSNGACCLDDGSCFFVPEATCDALDGAYQGDGTACEVVNCP